MNNSAQIEQEYHRGNLLEAERLAEEDPKLDISKEVIGRMADIREWNKTGKPAGYCDPESWEQMPKFQKTFDVIKENFGNHGVNILDVGCFTGYFSRKMNEFGHSAHGCDIQHKLMNMLNFRFCDGKEFFHPVRGENLSLYFEPGVFDVITFLDSLEHMLDDKTAVECAKKILRPNGLIIVHLPQGEKYKDESYEHLRIYSKDSILSMLPNCNIIDMKDEHGQPTFFAVWKKGVIEA